MDITSDDKKKKQIKQLHLT